MKLITIQIAKMRQAIKEGYEVIDTTVKSGDKRLAPTWDMVMGHKEGKVSDEEYTNRYEEIIKKSQEEHPEFWKELCRKEKIIIACYCKAGVFCHRHLLTKYIKEYCKENRIVFSYVGEYGDEDFIDPEMDGVNHINIYSKGATGLGSMLSNFLYAPTMIEGLVFNSIEAYWYYLSVEHEASSGELDELRKTGGYAAKQMGKELRRRYGVDKSLGESEFRNKICKAIALKIYQHPGIYFRLLDSELPLKHYYCYGSKNGNTHVVPVKEYQWITDYITELREKLKADQDKELTRVVILKGYDNEVLASAVVPKDYSDEDTIADMKTLAIEIHGACDMDDKITIRPPYKTTSNGTEVLEQVFLLDKK